MDPLVRAQLSVAGLSVGDAFGKTVFAHGSEALGIGLMQLLERRERIVQPSTPALTEIRAETVLTSAALPAEAVA